MIILYMLSLEALSFRAEDGRARARAQLRSRLDGHGWGLHAHKPQLRVEAPRQYHSDVERWSLSVGSVRGRHDHFVHASASRLCAFVQRMVARAHERNCDPGLQKWSEKPIQYRMANVGVVV